jgi:hypothetical protein
MTARGWELLEADVHDLVGRAAEGGAEAPIDACVSPP